MSITPLNLIKFEQFLVAAKKYVQASYDNGIDYDFAQ